MKSRIVVLSIAVASLIGLAPTTQATSMAWGDPVLGHSWDQLWAETSDHNFNNVIGRISAPPVASFEAPGFFGFSADSWVIQSSTGREIVATGAATDRLEFTTHFNGGPTDYTPSNPLILDLYFLSDNSVVDGHRWIWDGSVWVDPPPPGLPDGGSTLLLLGFSMLLMWAFIRKKLA